MTQAEREAIARGLVAHPRWREHHGQLDIDDFVLNPRSDVFLVDIAPSDRWLKLCGIPLHDQTGRVGLVHFNIEDLKHLNESSTSST